MKSCLYYPVTSNFFSVARFLYNQMALANSYLCSFGGSGLVGKSFEEVYGYNFIDQQVYEIIQRPTIFHLRFAKTQKEKQ